MSESSNKILRRMLERLYASLTNGPLLSCRPHSSRQRIDLMQLGRLDGPGPDEVLPLLLGSDRSVKFGGRREEPSSSTAPSPADADATSTSRRGSNGNHRSAEDTAVWT